jgi:hypothetical protein
MNQLNQPLSLSDILIANAIIMAPIYLLVARGIWYLSQMAYKVNLVYTWWEETQVRRRGAN